MNVWMLLGPVLLLGVVLGFVTYAILLERKVLGWMQGRHGPNRVGPWGIFQTVADVFKLLIKEDTIPAKADRTLFKMAPVIAFVPAFVVLAAIPFSEDLVFADIGVGVLISSRFPVLPRSGSWSGDGLPTTNMPCSGRCGLSLR